jgi:Flp pilus assembly protein TadG
MRRSSPTKLRAGLFSVELILVLPLLLLAVFALVEFSLLLAAERKLAEVSGVVARTGSLGGTDEEMTAVMKSALGPSLAEKAELKVVPAAASDRVQGAPLEVTVSYPARYAGPNVLRSLGIDLTAATLVGRTVIIVE